MRVTLKRNHRQSFFYNFLFFLIYCYPRKYTLLNWKNILVGRLILIIFMYSQFSFHFLILPSYFWIICNLSNLANVYLLTYNLHPTYILNHSSQSGKINQIPKYFLYLVDANLTNVGCVDSNSYILRISPMICQVHLCPMNK